MQKCDFENIAKQVNRTSVWVFYINLLHIFKIRLFKNTFPWELVQIQRQSPKGALQKEEHPCRSVN